MQDLSTGLAFLLIAAYGLGLVFSLRTHPELFASAGTGEVGEVPWPAGLAVATLAGVAVADCAGERNLRRIGAGGGPDLRHDIRVRGLHHRGPGGRRAAEMASAFSGARKNRLDLSVGIALGSASQIALFVAPVLVLLSYVIGPAPMDLLFWPGAVVMILIATITVVLVTSSEAIGLVHWRPDAHGVPDLRHDALSLAGAVTMAGRRAIGWDRRCCQLARTLPGAGSEEILPVRPLGEATICAPNCGSRRDARHSAARRQGRQQGRARRSGGGGRTRGSNRRDFRSRALVRGLVIALALLLGVITGPSLARARHPRQARTGRRKSASFWSCSTIPWCATGSRRSGTLITPPAAAPSEKARIEAISAGALRRSVSTSLPSLPPS